MSDAPKPEKEKFVKPSKHMDDETFLKHFNARHIPLAGLTAVRARMTPDVLKSLRNYHKRVHRLGEEGGPEIVPEGRPSYPRRPVNHRHRATPTPGDLQ